VPDFILSGNMGLPVPIVGVTIGPNYATDVNNCLGLVDSHDHSFGRGVQITPAGINISSDLAANSNNITLLRSTRYVSQPTPLNLLSDVNTIYTVGNDLFYNDGLGNQIRITQSGAITGTPGNISNLVAPASASYNSGTSTFIWQSGINIPAGMDNGPVTLRNLTLNSHGITISPPSSLSIDYTITLPLNPPATTQLLSMDNSGNIIANTNPNVLVPTGSITMYGGAAAPSGYLICDGSAVSRTTFANLFGAIATNYGIGDGSTTFNLPDFRGIFPRGVDSGAGNDPDSGSRSPVNGGNSGDNVGSFQSDIFTAHSHTFLSGSTSGGAVISPQMSSNASTHPSTSVVGGAETRPKNLYVTFIIKT
jgi:microcystin-dependent protein